MKHAIYAPSSAHRWLECPASIERSAALPSITTQAAQVGTYAHEVFEKGYSVGATEEMIEHVSGATAELFKRVGEAKLFREYHLPVWRVLGLSQPLIYGTADVVALGEDRAWVIDLKYGKHSVNPVENLQLLTYGVGLLGLVGESYQDFSLCILQPRQGAMWRQWNITLDVLHAHRDRLIAFFDSPKDVVSPGNHCYFCPAKSICVERIFGHDDDEEC
jgi:hypothetical protein